VRISLRTANAIAAAAAFCLAVVYSFAPSENSFYPDCLFLKVTGWECPGCGSTRALHALLHLHLAEAIALNPLFTMAFPLLMLWALLQYRAVLRNGTTFAIPLPRNAYAALFLAASVFGVMRNLSFGGLR
jgi:hypothetical protein